MNRGYVISKNTKNKEIEIIEYEQNKGFDVNPKNLENAVNGAEALNIRGLNVTIPHKIEVMKYLSEIDEIAEKFFNVDKIKSIFDEYVGGESDNWRKVWTIYTFLVWYEIYFK